MKAILTEHSEIAENLFSTYAISRYNTVASYNWLGKGSVIKTLKDGYYLSAIGIADASFQQVIKQTTNFISACYGIKSFSGGEKDKKRYATNPAVLPTTKEAFIDNIKRIHFQAITRQKLNENFQPELNSQKFERKKTYPIGQCPINLPDGGELVPDLILKMIIYSYKS